VFSHGGNILESCRLVDPALLLQKLREGLTEAPRPLDSYNPTVFSTSGFLKGVHFIPLKAREGL